MEVGTPLTLALQPGAGEGDGLGLGLGLGDGAGDGPVTVLGAVSFLLDPAQADASSANVSSTTGGEIVASCSAVLHLIRQGWR